ncbi:hypothetical protein CVH13_01629 [Dehalococcoides mccartyi]|uniref:4Fe-4S ferredoxin-type domain-containing protein n=1 Tax=Dehalococcoides mccartyi TaxID=61435 RepID=A0A2J1DSI1_9CHLR|nr:hypothetical protein CVH13_01629 [Dehalococcoides mccartyi]
MASKEKLGNFTDHDAPTYESVLQCMRCGFCLPTCPTFSLTGRERSSPRGRVALARAVAEGKLQFNHQLAFWRYSRGLFRTTSAPVGQKVTQR